MRPTPLAHHWGPDRHQAWEEGYSVDCTTDMSSLNEVTQVTSASISLAKTSHMALSTDEGPRKSVLGLPMCLRVEWAGHWTIFKSKLQAKEAYLKSGWLQEETKTGLGQREENVKRVGGPRWDLWVSDIWTVGGNINFRLREMTVLINFVLVNNLIYSGFKQLRKP